MKIKKWVALLLVVLMAVSTIGCASTSSEDTTEATTTETEAAAEATEAVTEETTEHDPVTITFGSWVFPEESVNYIYQEILDNFMAEYPWITVEIYTNSYADYLEQLVVAAAAGTGPDVAHIKNTWLAQLVEIGAVLSVNDYLSDETIADYNESAIEAVTDENGDMMAVDWFGNTESLIYNKALLEEAGWSIEDITSWDKLLEAAEDISALGTDDNGNTIYGFAIPTSWIETGEGYATLIWQWANGSDWMDDDGTINLTSEGTIEAYTQIQSLIENKITPYGYSLKEIRNAFGQGTIGFFYDIQAGVTTAASVAEDEDAYYDNVGLTTLNSVGSSGYVESHYLVALDTIDESKEEAVSLFLEYMSSADAIQVLYENNQGKMSDRTSVMAAVYGNVEDEITTAYVEAMAGGRALNVSNIAFLDADQALQDAIAKIAQGEDVATTMADAQTEIRALYGQE